uniref:Uncharacterized protein n=1 Tax=Leclercia adecarboxylata TaxID=83655 RepID=A0A7G5F5Y1_9ENTR|nr:hypothetical protein [Leclercia adecarboxylata]
MLQIGCHSLEVGRSSQIHKRSGCFNLLRGICTAAQHEGERNHQKASCVLHRSIFSNNAITGM